MSVKFKALERVDPRDVTLPRKFYAKIIKGDEVNFDNLADIISKVAGLNYGQVVGTLGSLREVIEMQLKYGREVRLSNLGTLFLTLNSNGVDDASELSSNDIKKASIRFRPGKRLKRLVKTLDFEKVSVSNNTNSDEAQEAA